MLTVQQDAALEPSEVRLLKVTEALPPTNANPIANPLDGTVTDEVQPHRRRCACGRCSTPSP